MSKKQVLFVGIDVSRKTLHLCIHGDDRVYEFANEAAGHKQLITFLKKRRKACHLVLESTGVYGLDIALALQAVISFVVHYLNPIQARNFAKAVMRRAKTDKVDARCLAAMAAAIKLPVWQPPTLVRLQLRAMTRRARKLVEQQTAEKNRRSAVQATNTSPECVLADIDEHLTFLAGRIKRLQKLAWEKAQQDEELAGWLDILVTVPGIAEVTGTELVAEMGCLPADLTPKQLVAQAGLDPRPKQSGMVDSARHISKMGSSHLRCALHIAAVNVVRWSPQVRAQFDRLHVEKNKPKLVAYTAIARKLLVVLHTILANGSTFQPERFGSTSVPQAA